MQYTPGIATTALTLLVGPSLWPFFAAILCYVAVVAHCKRKRKGERGEKRKPEWRKAWKRGTIDQKS